MAVWINNRKLVTLMHNYKKPGSQAISELKYLPWPLVSQVSLDNRWLREDPDKNIGKVVILNTDSLNGTHRQRNQERHFFLLRYDVSVSPPVGNRISGTETDSVAQSFSLKNLKHVPLKWSPKGILIHIFHRIWISYLIKKKEPLNSHLSPKEFAFHVFPKTICSSHLPQNVLWPLDLLELPAFL